MQYTIPIVSGIIGVVVTTVIRIAILQAFRINWVKGYYRTQPAGINVLFIINEAWSLGLATWTIIVRAIRVLAVAIFYIGRLDTPVLAPNVGWLLNRFPPDLLPITFRKEVLVHDAHRHPFIERMGLLYMLKLRHGTNFGTQAGAMWRILITVALMPWLRRYRTANHDDSLYDRIKGMSTESSSAFKAKVNELLNENARLRKTLKAFVASGGAAGSMGNQRKIHDEMIEA